MIELHPQLEKDCFILGEFELCALLLRNDATYPWFILLPKRRGISEIHQLSETDQQQTMAESIYFSHCLEQVYKPDKLNIATLGNIVPQLHIHHIARFRTDASWPAPVWGANTAISYEDEQLALIKKQLFSWFDDNKQQLFQQAASSGK